MPSNDLDDIKPERDWWHMAPISEPSAVAGCEIAEAIDRLFRPRLVVTVSRPAGFLLHALWARGIEASGLDIDQLLEPQRDLDAGQDAVDLVICTEGLGLLAGDDLDTAVRRLTSFAKALLFSPAESDDRKCHPPSKALIAWLELFRAYDFEPDVLFDGAFLGPACMLLRPVVQSRSADLVALYADHIAGKAALKRQRGHMTALESELEAAKSQMGRLRGSYDQLAQDLLRRAGEVTRLEDTVRRGDARVVRLEECLNQMDADLREVKANLADLTRKSSQQQASVAGLSQQVDALGTAVDRVSGDVWAILQSRSWRSICFMGSLLLVPYKLLARLSGGSDRWKVGPRL
jgi:hypothetical protein